MSCCLGRKHESSSSLCVPLTPSLPTVQFQNLLFLKEGGGEGGGEGGEGGVVRVVREVVREVW